MIDLFQRLRGRIRPFRTRASRPVLEGLEERFLLYAATTNIWPNPVRVTYSFMPDGTSIGTGSGPVPSTLFATLNPDYSTAAWQGLFAKAAASWEAVANINFVPVSDDGSPMGSGNYIQGAPNFGDIRVGAMPLPAGELAETIMPPSSTVATPGDGTILFNSNVNWSSATGFDFMTVAVHEVGHELGLDESSVTTAVMFANYTGVRQVLTSDDIAGAQYEVGARVAGSNSSYTTATPVSLNSSAQAVVTGVQIASATNYAWYSVVVPSNTSGTLTVTMQSSNLSLLEPRLALYNSALHGLSMVGATTYGGTVSVTLNGVTPGQLYYIRASANVSGPGDAGAYGLNVNAGTGTMPAIAPPDTTVIYQPFVALNQVAYMTTTGSLQKPAPLTPAEVHAESRSNGLRHHSLSNVQAVVTVKPHHHSPTRVWGQATPSVSRHASW